MPSHDAEHWAADLSAYLDGELSPAERRRVDALLAESPHARRMLDELRSASQAVKSLPRATLPVEVASRQRDEIKRRGVPSPRAAAPLQTRLFLWTVRAGSMAALVAVFAVAGWQLTRGRVDGPEATKAIALRDDADSRDERTLGGTRALRVESGSRGSTPLEGALPDLKPAPTVAAAHTFEVTIVPATQAEHDDIRRQLSNFSGLVAAGELLRNQQAYLEAARVSSATPPPNSAVDGEAEGAKPAASGLRSVGYAGDGEKAPLSGDAGIVLPLQGSSVNQLELSGGNTPYVAYDLNLTPQSLDKLVHTLRLQVGTEENSASGVWLLAAADAAKKSSMPVESLAGGYGAWWAAGVAGRMGVPPESAEPAKDDAPLLGAAPATVDKDSDGPKPIAEQERKQRVVRSSPAPSAAPTPPAAGRAAAPATGARGAARGGAVGGGAVSPEKSEVEARRERIAARKEAQRQSAGRGRAAGGGRMGSDERDATGPALDAGPPPTRQLVGGASASAAEEAKDSEARSPAIPPEVIARAGRSMIDFVKGVSRETRNLLDSVTHTGWITPAEDDGSGGQTPINVRINLLPPADAGARPRIQAVPEPDRSRTP